MRFLRAVRNLLGNYQLKSGIYHYDRGESQQAIEYLTRALGAADSTESDRAMALYYLTHAVPHRHRRETRIDRGYRQGGGSVSPGPDPDA
jgi:tetratricopeptide (TPR) repeat protein